LGFLLDADCLARVRPVRPDEGVDSHDPSVAERVADRSPLLELDAAGNALARVTGNDSEPIGTFLDHLFHLLTPAMLNRLYGETRRADRKTLERLIREVAVDLDAILGYFARSKPQSRRRQPRNSACGRLPLVTDWRRQQGQTMAEASGGRRETAMVRPWLWDEDARS
jgi:hypothetical protein